MSVQLFVAALAAGAALLALWLHVRLPNLTPSVPRAVAHLVLAGVVLYFFVPDAASGSVPAAFSAAFLVVLPGLVYAFLASIWVLRLMQAATLSR